MATRTPRDILSELWSPVCAIGSHGARGPNAQICVSVFGASVVPERPRLLVNLWKDNYTHDLALASGTLAITALSEQQAGLIEPLGMASGRECDKLARLPVELTRSGDPFFPGYAGSMACEVIDAFDLGDATGFVVAVTERARASDAAMLTRERMWELLGNEFAARWAQIAAQRAERYAGQMVWRESASG